MPIITASDFESLPDASLNNGAIANVTNSTEDNYKGLYASDGTVWNSAVLSGDMP